MGHDSKADWITYLHSLRTCEIEIIFSMCPAKAFKKGLELGAGDGFQSELLSKYLEKLISTDLNSKRLKKCSNEEIEYLICDAEEVDENFSEKEFDIVFSSNLFEHLPNPERCLEAIDKVLKDDGIAVLIMPNPFWKLCQLLLYYPHLVFRQIRSARDAGGIGKRIKQLRRKLLNQQDYLNEQARAMGNNPKTMRDNRGYLRSVLWPEPHGVYDGHIQEFFAYRKKRWLTELESAGFEVFKIVKGPVFSGYNFGLRRIKAALQKMGFCSEYIYIVEKQQAPAIYRNFF